MQTGSLDPSEGVVGTRANWSTQGAATSLPNHHQHQRKLILHCQMDSVSLCLTSVKWA